MIYINYEAKLSSPFGRGMELEYNDGNIERVQFSIKELNVLEIKFYLQKVNNREDAKQKTWEFLKDVLNLISYKFNLSYEEPYPVEFYYYGERKQFGRFVSTSFSTLQIIGDYESELLSSLQNKGLLKELKNNSYHQILRAILLTDDIIAKYVLLYSLLQLVVGNQANVEDFIKRNEPNVEFMTRMKTDGKKETKTVYTCLRNKVGHFTSNETVDGVIKDINRTINGLIRHVKTAIEQNKE